MDSRPFKRIKLSPEPTKFSPTLPDGRPGHDVADPQSIRAKRAAFLSSISRSISPPGVSTSATATPQPPNDEPFAPGKDAAAYTKATPKSSSLASGHHDTQKAADTSSSNPGAERTSRPKLLPSPFNLTSIRNLPSSKNVDAVSLHQVLSNPLIKEAWVFNYCFDVDWMMSYFDSDIRSQVKVKIVHGSWRTENSNKIGIDDACRRWNNVEAFTAYLPDPFGTHHSKMFILFTHDDHAQVIIHTANMLEKDWTNMTQAAWASPMLTLLDDQKSTPTFGKIGSGSRFKHDLLAYLAAYGSKAKSLRNQLAQFDFSSVRGALIASVPSHMKDFSTSQDVRVLSKQKLWGYPSLLRALKTILLPQKKTDYTNDDSYSPSSHVVCQISSIATLPQTWLNQFFPILANLPSPNSTNQAWDPSRISVLYPTPANVATSLDGYASGGSIHTKAQSAAHLKQIAGLRNTLCQWSKGPKEATRSGRHEAAPHIKTYVCFSAKPTMEKPVQDIRWALLTSANLSQQAWGTLRETGKGKQKEKEVVVQSFEIGVLVWPELFAEDFDTGEEEGIPQANISGRNARMVPVFGSDTPSPPDINSASGGSSTLDTLVGLRLPYDLPLTPYGHDDMPWSMQGTYEQADRFDRRWPRDFH